MTDLLIRGGRIVDGEKGLAKISVELCESPSMIYSRTPCTGAPTHLRATTDAARYSGLYQFLYDRWRVDEFYEETVIGAVDSLAEFGAWADKWLVDGIRSTALRLVVQVEAELRRRPSNDHGVTPSVGA